jgi:hypothetical protein
MTPGVGDLVRHRLYPELGSGTVHNITGAEDVPSHRRALVAWPTGQTSVHDLSVLKVVDQ